MVKEIFRRYKEYPKSYFLVGDNGKDTHVRNLYKYMDMDTAMICLKNNTLRFVQPSQWPDQYEKHFYGADFKNVTNDTAVTPKLWACCFTQNKISEAAWNTYRYNKHGLGERCVKFKLKRKGIRDAIKNDKRILSSYEGQMDYSINDNDIQQMHKNTSSLYSRFFPTPFTLENYMRLMYIKRSAFYYEKEFRFIIESNLEKKDDKELMLPVNWKDILLGIELDKDCSDTEIELFKERLKTAKVSEDVINSVSCVNLYEDPAPKIEIDKPLL